ncbi:hypothetical protein ACFX13_044309 [Malus domestica]
MGMDLHPTPSLSHIILSFPPAPSSSSSSPSTASPSSFPSSWSSSSLSSTSLPDDVVPLPFPCLSAAPISYLRAFVKLSKDLFKLVFVRSDCNPVRQITLVVKAIGIAAQCRCFRGSPVTELIQWKVFPGLWWDLDIRVLRGFMRESEFLQTLHSKPRK